MKIGVMFGSPETTTRRQRAQVLRLGPPRHPPHRRHQRGAASDKKDPAVVGNRTRVKVVKNKMAPPFREVEFDILYGQGISRAGDVIDLATEVDIVEKSGAWFSFQGERIGQGRENARTYLEQHPDMLDKIESAGARQARHRARPSLGCRRRSPPTNGSCSGQQTKGASAPAAAAARPVAKGPAN